MKDDEGKPITLVHDRFQVCCAICGLVTTSTTKTDAIERAKRHRRCLARVEVWDAMAHDKSKDIVWSNITANQL